MENFTVADLIRETAGQLALSPVAGEGGLSRPVTSSPVNCLGLVLAGHLEHFPSEKVQMYDIQEHSYCAAREPEAREQAFRRLFSSYPGLPCVIVTEGIDPVRELTDQANQYATPVLRTERGSEPARFALNAYLEKKLAPATTLHASFVKVYGTGVLITGKSGIGKSECALDLVKNGHIFVGDDAIEVRLRPGGVLIGSSKEIVREHMEVRGIGIIDIRALLGIGVVADTAKVELMVEFEEWAPGLHFDRSGVEEHTTSILGIEIPLVRIPVLPGRNVAGLVEIAALNQQLKHKGYYSARQFDRRLIDLMKEKQKKNTE
jgi:HPr kinase/phosphorylase